MDRTLGAEDRELARPVAIKPLHADLADAQSRARFAREAKLTAGLDHPHLVRIDDFGGESGGPLWIVYELIDGRSLASRLANGIRVGSDEVLRWASELTSALAAVHRAGVLHRDLKPANILLRSDGAAVLGDFGIARRQGQGTVISQEGIILGTPGFLAPELWLGANPSPASDQWALAATLFEALARPYPLGLGAHRDTSVLVMGMFRLESKGESMESAPLEAINRSEALPPGGSTSPAPRLT